MPAWSRPSAKCLRSRRSWGCKAFRFLRRCLWRRRCFGRRRARPPAWPGRCVCPWAAPPDLRRCFVLPDVRRCFVPPDVRRCFAPPDFRPPRGLPAREPSAPRASLGASSRSPARPRRPRVDLQSGVPVVRVLPPWPCRRPPAPRPGPVDQAVRFFETPVAFASLCPCEVETGVAFAGEKRVFLARFSVADVLLVSALPFCCVLCAKKFALLGLVWV